MLLTPHHTSSLIPLVLDLDGTLIRTDTFHEMMLYLLTHKPFILLALPFWFIKGRAYAKFQLVDHTDLSLETLPYNMPLLSFAQKEAEQGRSLILATGTDQRLAQKISDHLGIFQEVIGSNGKINMTGDQKRNALLSRFGLYGFDYAGDSSLDSSIWKVSREVLIVCPKWGTLKKVLALRDWEHIHCIPREKTRIFSFFLALRPLFFACNLATSSVNLFVGLSLLSAGLLIGNDLLTLERERKGFCRIKSVFAEGHLHLLTAFILVPVLALSSLFFMLSMPKEAFHIGGYIILFLGLDRFTRSSSLFLRWSLLGLFQIIVALTIGIKPEAHFLLQ